jgi:hypothetical protein
MARSTDDPKRAPIQRMSPIKNHDLVGEGFVSLTRWGIPEPPRWRGSTGGRRRGHGSRWRRDNPPDLQSSDSHKEYSGINWSHARSDPDLAGRPRGAAQLHRAASGRGQGAGDPDREAPAPVGRAPGAPVRNLLGDGRATATGLGDQRDCRRRDDRTSEASGHRGEGQTQARSDPGPHPPDGSGTQPRHRCLCRLWRSTAPDRGGCDRRTGVCPRPLTIALGPMADNGSTS